VYDLLLGFSEIFVKNWHNTFLFRPFDSFGDFSLTAPTKACVSSRTNLAHGGQEPGEKVGIIGFANGINVKLDECIVLAGLLGSRPNKLCGGTLIFP